MKNVRTRRLAFAGLASALMVAPLASVTSAGASRVGRSSSSSGVAAAKAGLAKWEKFPTSIFSKKLPQLKTKPPKGKTFIWLQCDLPQCALMGNAMASATSAAGWHYKAISFQSANPATLVAAFQQALVDKASAVGLSGIPYFLWSSVIPAYRKAHVPIITTLIGPGVPQTATTPIQIAGSAYEVRNGQMLADYVVAKSNGTAKVLDLNVPSYTILNEDTSGFKYQVAKLCQACKVTEIDATIPQLDSGQINGLIVSELQRNPSIGWVFLTDAAFAPGLPAALAAAGLSRVKVVGVTTTTEQIADIKAGTEQAFVGGALSLGQWVMLDAAIRSVEGMKIPAAESLVPAGIIDASNVNRLPAANYNDYQYPTDYQKQFLKLWKLAR